MFSIHVVCGFYFVNYWNINDSGFMFEPGQPGTSLPAGLALIISLISGVFGVMGLEKMRQSIKQSEHIC
jgi:hypothetical protein